MNTLRKHYFVIVHDESHQPLEDVVVDTIFNVIKGSFGLDFYITLQLGTHAYTKYYLEKLLSPNLVYDHHMPHLKVKCYPSMSIENHLLVALLLKYGIVDISQVYDLPPRDKNTLDHNGYPTQYHAVIQEQLGIHHHRSAKYTILLDKITDDLSQIDPSHDFKIGSLFYQGSIQRITLLYDKSSISIYQDDTIFVHHQHQSTLSFTAPQLILFKLRRYFLGDDSHIKQMLSKFTHHDTEALCTAYRHHPKIHQYFHHSDEETTLIHFITHILKEQGATIIS